MSKAQRPNSRLLLGLRDIHLGTQVGGNLLFIEARDFYIEQAFNLSVFTYLFLEIHHMIIKSVHRRLKSY